MSVKDDFFVAPNLDDEKPKEVVEKKAPIRTEMSKKLLAGAAESVVRNVVLDGPKERVIIRFVAPKKNLSCDVDVPLDITANDLVIGLNSAYHLGIDVSDVRQCYLICENPVALIKGKRMLGEYGVRDGSLITYDR